MSDTQHALIDDARCRLLVQRAEDARFTPGAFDALVTDPPAGIAFMGRAWDASRGGRNTWIAWLTPILRTALDALKPGAYALVWALPRTSHWTATAIEDAGFEICDVHHHIFGTGFPKHASKLKPAVEHWILARRPASRPTLLNIDECRIGTGEGIASAGGTRRSGGILGKSEPLGGWQPTPGQGRWPAHLSLDDEAAAALDEQSGTLTSGRKDGGKYARETGVHEGGQRRDGTACYADTGGASRFFYVAKASKAEKNHGLPDGLRNTHETVKSVALMRWLIRLITPPGGTVLDLFAGSGTTGVAALAEGRRFVGVEQDEQYAAIAEARLRHAINGAA